MTDQATQNLISSLVKKHAVLLFMKGSPDFPQCGFSSQVVSLLRECGCDDFHAVNVLEDESIRQGIKVYADWPTIPQLYINGDFVGGCDIVTEMVRSNELQKLLDSKASA